MSRKKDTAEDAAKMGLAVLRFFGKVIFWIVVVMFLYTGITKGYQFGYKVFHSTAVSSGTGIEKEIVIPENPTAGSVAKTLKENGLIKDSMVFWVQYILFECEPKAGVYTLNTSMTSRDIIEYLNKAGTDDDSE